MVKYYNSGIEYQVDAVELDGAIINVNGTSITDCAVMAERTGNPFMACDGYLVFCDSDEIGFDTFEEAYEFAMYKQKDIFSIN